MKHLRPILLGCFQTFDPLTLLCQKIQSSDNIHICQLFGSALPPQPVLVSLINIVFITKQLRQKTNQPINPKIILDSSRAAQPMLMAKGYQKPTRPF
jgi:hypothetical protein